MADNDVKALYEAARINGAKTLAESYDHYKTRPECFTAGVQYALDRMLGQADRQHNLPYPHPGIGDVVTIRMLHRMAVDILTQVKESRL